MIQSAASPPITGNTRRVSLRTLIGQFGAFIFLIALVVIFSVLKPESFPTSLNLFNIARQASITGIIAVGMTFVVLTGGIDLSVGSMLALSGIVAAAAYKGGAGLLDTSAGQTSGVGVGAAILIACGVGVLCGLVQGLVIVRLKIQPFVVTLGGLSVFRGLTLIVGNGGPISAFDASFRYWGQGRIAESVPIPVLIFLGLAIIAFVILRYTQYGRYIYAVGGNREAARLSGLNTNLLLVSVFVIVGFTAGLAGFVLSARLNSAEGGGRDGLRIDRDCGGRDRGNQPDGGRGRRRRDGDRGAVDHRPATGTHAVEREHLRTIGNHRCDHSAGGAVRPRDEGRQANVIREMRADTQVRPYAMRAF